MMSFGKQIIMLSRKAVLGVALLGFCYLGAGVDNVKAQKLSHVSKFTVYFAGLPIAKAAFNLAINKTEYQISLSGKTIGLTKLLANGNGTVRSTGRVVGQRVRSDLQRLSYKDSKKKINTLLVFKNGNVVSEKFTPKPKEHSDTIPIYESDKLGVLDPASAIIIPVKATDIGNGKKVCNKTLPIYDGGARYDIYLKYKRDEQLEIAGFSGKTIVCQLRWIPISGHRPKENVKKMAANKDMEISFAQVGNVGLYMPIKIKVPTKYGMITANATEFATKE